MDSALLYDRLQFAFTATFHYLFPQLTMGLALLLLYLRSRVLLTGDKHYEEVADFWTKVFAINFGFGVVTGIPLEFQFGTNWARFSNYAGGVIGQTLAMEGTFAFFLESSFLGILLFRKRFSRRVQWFSTLMLFLGTWLSGYFILATNAWMQHPVAYQVAADGRVFVNSLSGLLTNPWLFWQYAHNMTATVLTASAVVAAVGAYYLLSGQYLLHAKTFLCTGVVAGAIASGLMIFPTGHGNADQVFKYQPIKGAAFEGLFTTEREAGLYLVGQPNLETMTIDNPIEIPGALSFLVYNDLYAKVKGLDAFPRDEWPDNLPLLYYAYHVMAGLGTIFALLFGAALVSLWRGWLFHMKWLLWWLMLCAPFPYIATSAGWMTAELGRQPWLVYGLLRTSHGTSPLVHSGNALFTLIGFLGLYLLLGLLFVLLVSKVIRQGPSSIDRPATHVPQGSGH
ncbi:MAG: cytochrome ubiquinol oxidase subunit I [Nitrospira sp.]|nr:cytochrome ubiquinol oxidase subunit I [Nitrospira sp.]